MFQSKDFILTLFQISSISSKKTANMAQILKYKCQFYLLSNKSSKEIIKQYVY